MQYDNIPIPTLAESQHRTVFCGSKDVPTSLHITIVNANAHVDRNTLTESLYFLLKKYCPGFNPVVTLRRVADVGRFSCEGCTITQDVLEKYQVVFEPYKKLNWRNMKTLSECKSGINYDCVEVYMAVLLLENVDLENTTADIFKVHGRDYSISTPLKWRREQPKRKAPIDEDPRVTKRAKKIS